MATNTTAHGLSKEQKGLRTYYAKLLHLAAEPGFRFGGLPH